MSLQTQGRLVHCRVLACAVGFMGSGLEVYKDFRDKVSGLEMVLALECSQRAGLVRCLLAERALTSDVLWNCSHDLAT